MTPSATDGMTNGASKGIRPPTISSFLQQIEGVSGKSFPDDGERAKALVAVYDLVARLETPWETIARLCMGQPALGAALKTVKDLKLFETWHAQDDESRTDKELASMVSCDELLLERMLRHLAANHVVEQVSPGTYRQTTFSLALLEPNFGEWINYLYDAIISCFYKMPEYLAKTGYANPTDPADGVFQYTKGIKEDLFEYYDKNQREGKSFNHVMGGVMAHQASWLDIFPTERLIKTASEDSALVVDVGGNVGHDVEKFRSVYPGLAARLVLQDRAEVIRNSTCPDPVKKMAHDFFTPQPVTGARVYYMHGVLHDWSDEPARKILENIKPAMKRGYSTLLVHDHVIPEDKPHPQATAYDLTMMVKVAGLERPEGMWRELLESAGYKVIKVWTSPRATQSIIEAELA